MGSRSDRCQTAARIEGVRVLGAAIESALQDADQAVDEAVNSFMRISMEVDSLVRDLHLVEAGADSCVEPQFARSIELRSSGIQGRLCEIVTAFQFYDRLRQRLEHVQRILEAIGVSDDPEGRVESTGVSRDLSLENSKSGRLRLSPPADTGSAITLFGNAA